MPTNSFLRTIRTRRRNGRRRLGTQTGIKTGLLVLLTLFIGGIGIFLAAVGNSILRDLPDVGIIESQFGLRGIEHFRPMVVLDRTETQVLFEVRSIHAREAEWVKIQEDGSSDLSAAFLEVLFLTLDDSFWTNPGYDLSQISQRVLVELGLADGDSGHAYSLTERLVKTTLIPPSDKDLPQILREIRVAFTAGELTQRYPKAQILAWYLNSVNFGYGLYGTDAASLHIFQKHAADLTLAEGALLVALLADPALQPESDPEATLAARNSIIELMFGEGLILERQAESASASALEGDFSQLGSIAGDAVDKFIWTELQRVLGLDTIHRSGLTVRTTIDLDLQLQVECTGLSQVSRLNGAAADNLLPAADGSTCVAAGFLPPLRPRDAGLNHQVEDWGVVALDPVKGEILTLAGDIQPNSILGPVYYPFIYLTAFSQGYSPASMVIDGGGPSDPSLGDGAGPVRIRTALANMYSGAAEYVLDLVGVEEAVRVTDQLGLQSIDERSLPGDRIMADLRADLLQITTGFGVFANRGILVGGNPMASNQSNGVSSLLPTILLDVKDVEGLTLYEWSPTVRPVLSPELAYLVTDVLSDDEARWPTMGQPNPLDVGRPAGAIAAQDAQGFNNWTIGFTPQLAVGVWLGNSTSPFLALDRSNGTTSIWHAVMRYGSRALPPEDWDMPAGVSQVEVCTPSGLLPTRYCPETVMELFLTGTEPISYDTLYQGVLVNKETGKLATLYTPLDLVEERVYFVPPPEAAEWAEQVGVERPPQEYDTLSQGTGSVENVAIHSPQLFQVVAKQIEIRGDARPPEFAYYRLQYGEGLNPSQWTQLGEDQSRPVRNGRLGFWDTASLTGLYTLQLLVVLDNGQVRTSIVPLRIDNQSPVASLISPFSGQRYRIEEDPWITYQVSAEDNFEVSRVEYFLDDTLIGSTSSPPHSLQWPVGHRPASHLLYVKVSDAAGNTARSEPIQIFIEP